MPLGHQLNFRLPPEDWAWLESHPGLRPQDVMRALVQDGRERGVTVTVEERRVLAPEHAC